MSDQKPTAKKTFLKHELLQQVSGWANWLEGSLSRFVGNWGKMRNVAYNNFELGKYHFQRGNISDAIFRFKMVVWLEPAHTDAWFFLGTAYMADNKMAAAAKAIERALKLKPDYEEAIYMLAIAKGRSAKASELPSRMPVTLAKSHFDGVAPEYTKEQLELLGYEGHTQLCKAIRAALSGNRTDHEVIDLGVGTGLCGPLMRDIAIRLVGVDLSPVMLAEAKKLQENSGKKIYDALMERELHDFLEESNDAAADVIMAATTFSYVGDLSRVFAQVPRVLRPGGVFAFTVDSMAEDGFKLDTLAGRFRFSQSYIERLAAEAGLAKVQVEEVAAYPAYMMLLCVFSK